MKNSIWVVIPAFNEGEVIATVVSSLRKCYSQVIVVDDCSSDGTSAQALQTGARVLRHPINLGQGAALQTGITDALRQGADYIVTFDADGQHRIEDIAVLLEMQKQTGVDVVVGSRFLGKAQGIPALRLIMLKLAVVFTSITSKVRLTDAHNGLRVLTRAAASRIHLRQNRMAHASEIIEQIGQLKMSISEAPVTIVYTAYSLRKGQKMGNAFNILIEIFIERINR